VTLIGSFGFSGFFPVAPATFASLVFLLIFLFLPGGKALAGGYVLMATLVVSVPVSTYMEKLYGHDAGCIVIDEIVGMQVILAGAVTGVGGAVAAFFLFRLFDVVKPFPAGASQKLPGGLGVVADDVFAAIYTRLALVLITLALPSVGSFGL
jgi:phosphatidylglycerophosphatase A